MHLSTNEMKYANYAMISDVPFQLVIERAEPDKQAVSLSCTKLLRFVPGRRKVYEALWNGRKVIAKVFSHKLSAKRHLRREWKGLTNLAHRKLNAPKPLFFGQTGDGQWVVVAEKISGSSTAMEIYQKLHDSVEKLDLLILIGRELAKQHIEGVMQKDLHLGNFLVQGNEIFLLDAGQIRFCSHQLGRKKSLSQLSMLAAWLSDDRKEDINKLCKQYYKVRGWNFEESDQTIFWKYLASCRKRAVRKGLKKSLRTSKRFIKIKRGQYVGVFDKSFCRDAEPFYFIEHIDALMDEGRILKNGNTCYVSRLTWNGMDVVVKRYNHKGIIHSLRHTIKRSRARRCWLNGHRLVMYNFTTPKPLVYFEQRRGFLIWKSYLVTEYADGLSLYHYQRDENIPSEKRKMAMQEVKNLLHEMAGYRITHGDLKHTNILITEKGPVLTDLDSMRFHKCNITFRARRDKDILRFG
jgi:tRNA A-37 threonylcarbamoyl transferase component Bud32